MWSILLEGALTLAAGILKAASDSGEDPQKILIEATARMTNRDADLRATKDAVAAILAGSK